MISKVEQKILQKGLLTVNKKALRILTRIKHDFLMFFLGLYLLHMGYDAAFEIDYYRGFRVPHYLGYIEFLAGFACLYGVLFTPANIQKICPRCQTAIRTRKDLCPHCNILLEPLKGFYKRHPELKDFDK